MKTEEQKKLNCKKLYERLLRYFDKLNMLSYSRDDIQMIDGKKNYFRAVALKTQGIDSTYDLAKELSPKKDDLPSIYICTQENEAGVTSKSELPKVWCEKYVEKMQDAEYFVQWPKSLKALAANSVEELDIKLAVLGY